MNDYQIVLLIGDIPYNLEHTFVPAFVLSTLALQT